MTSKDLDLLRDKLILISKDICPAAIYNDVIKKYPDGIAQKWFDATLPDLIKFESGLALDSKSTQKKKVRVRASPEIAFERFTRSKARMITTTTGTNVSTRAQPLGLDGTSDMPTRIEKCVPNRFKGYSPLISGSTSDSTSDETSSSSDTKWSKLTLGDPAMPIEPKEKNKQDSLSPKNITGKGPKRLTLRHTSSNESLRGTARSGNQKSKIHKRGVSTSSQSSNGSLKRITFYHSGSDSSPEIRAGNKPRNAAGKRTIVVREDGFNSNGVKRLTFVESSPEPERDNNDPATLATTTTTTTNDVCFRMRPGDRDTSVQLASHSLYYETQNPPSVLVYEEKRRKVEFVDLTGSDDDKDDEETPEKALEAVRLLRPMSIEELENQQCQTIKQESQPAPEPVEHANTTTANDHGHKKSKSNASDSTLSSIDEQQLAHLERCHDEYVNAKTTGFDASASASSSTSSDSSFAASPQHSSSTAAAAAAVTSTKTTNKTKATTTTTTTTTTAPSPTSTIPRFIVLDAQTWNLQAYPTAARARARCQEHPAPVSRNRSSYGSSKKKKQSNKVQTRRNALLAVAAPIDIGHGGMQLFVHDAAHNGIATALMRTGVADVAKKWDRAFARLVVFGRERRGVGEWVRARGLAGGGDDVGGDDDDEEEEEEEMEKKLVDPGVPCLYYAIRAKVAELRRSEGYEKKKKKKKQDDDGDSDVEMVDAE